MLVADPQLGTVVMALSIAVGICWRRSGPPRGGQACTVAWNSPLSSCSDDKTLQRMQPGLFCADARCNAKGKAWGSQAEYSRQRDITCYLESHFAGLFEVGCRMVREVVRQVVVGYAGCDWVQTMRACRSVVPYEQTCRLLAIALQCVNNRDLLLRGIQRYNASWSAA